MKIVIDADTHVVESESMWECFDREMYSRRPVLVKVPDDTLYGKFNAFWLIDGNIMPKPAGRGSFILITPSAAEFNQGRCSVSIGSRELTDLDERLADMQRLDVGVQVVYPTLFLMYLTADPTLEVALCRAYNRYVAQASERSGGRLRWVLIPPLQSMETTLAELQWAKEHGAVGVFLRGIEGDRTLDDPYFFPMYAEAERLDLPICIHTGGGCPTWTQLFDIQRNSSLPSTRILPVLAFRDLVANKVPERFPRLRFGFIEAGASWVPYVLHAIKRASREPAERWSRQLFEEYRIYVACEADEDIPYLAHYIGEDNLMIGSDYGHNDPSSEADHVAAIRTREDLSPGLAEKILCDNAARFYGL
jgi:predicted TIM-barrel fold metal-dependent hydrolase